jgi:hypothetical protein
MGSGMGAGDRSVTRTAWKTIAIVAPTLCRGHCESVPPATNPIPRTSSYRRRISAPPPAIAAQGFANGDRPCVATGMGEAGMVVRRSQMHATRTVVLSPVQESGLRHSSRSGRTGAFCGPRGSGVRRQAGMVVVTGGRRGRRNELFGGGLRQRPRGNGGRFVRRARGAPVHRRCGRPRPTDGSGAVEGFADVPRAAASRMWPFDGLSGPLTRVFGGRGPQGRASLKRRWTARWRAIG